MVAIPPEIEYLGEGAFGGVRCEIEKFSPKFLSFKGVLYDARRTKVLHCSPSIAAIGFSEGVKEIGAYAFMNCDRLRYIRFPENLKFIGSNAFGSCQNIRSLTIPRSVETVGPEAFCGCRIQTMYIYHPIYSLGEDAFATSRVISIPKGSFSIFSPILRKAATCSCLIERDEYDENV